MTVHSASTFEWMLPLIIFLFFSLIHTKKEIGTHEWALSKPQQLELLLQHSSLSNNIGIWLRPCWWRYKIIHRRLNIKEVIASIASHSGRRNWTWMISSYTGWVAQSLLRWIRRADELTLEAGIQNVDPYPWSWLYSLCYEKCSSAIIYIFFSHSGMLEVKKSIFAIRMIRLW